MNDRIHRALDGELSQSELSPAERRELRAAEQLLQDVLRAAAPPALASQRNAVLQRIAAPVPARPSPFAKLLAWLWSPARVSLSLRPAYAVGFAALVAVVGGIAVRSSRASGEHVATARATAATVLVQFRFDAPRAHAVSLAGDFTNWAPSYRLQRSAPGAGTWTVVVPLTPGVHDYSFIVDGTRWTPDPAAPARSDGFGGMDSRIAVLAADAVKAL